MQIIKAVCGFIVQTKAGELNLLLALMMMYRLPEPKEFDEFIEAVRTQIDEVVVLGLGAIYDFNDTFGNFYWQSEKITQNDIDKMLDYIVEIA